MRMSIYALFAILIFSVIGFGQSASAKPKENPNKQTVVAPETVKPLTNQDIIEMSKAELPAAVIISKINTTPTAFQTDLEGLKILNAEKVAESVVSAMIEKKTVVEAPQEVKTNSYTPAPDPNFSKETEKIRFKSPAQIQIGASRERISQILTAAFQGWNYQLDSNSNGTMLFSKEVPGMGNKILAQMATGDSNARYQIQASLAEFDNRTIVTINVSIRSQNAFGRVNTNSLNGNKKLRRELDHLLLQVKRRAEENE